MLWLCTALLPVAMPVTAGERAYTPFVVTGTVVKNHDGDTIRLMTADRGTFPVRLSGADTPETGQAYWRVARDHLHLLVDGTPTTVSCYKKDRFERDVCHVFIGDIDVGLDLIRNGYAWFAADYARELTASQQASYPAAELEARKRKIGLWIDPEPMPPEVCRKLRRAGKKCR